MLKRRVRIRFSHLDAAGVVFFPRYFTLAHDLLEDLVARAGFGWTEWFANPRWIAPLRHVEADYFRPLRGGDVCDATLRLVEMTAHSVTFLCALDREGERAAEMRLVVAFAARESGRKISVPDVVRARLGSRTPEGRDRPAQPRRRRRSSARRSLPRGERGIRST